MCPVKKCRRCAPCLLSFLLLLSSLCIVCRLPCWHGSVYNNAFSQCYGIHFISQPESHFRVLPLGLLPLPLGLLGCFVASSFVGFTHWKKLHWPSGGLPSGRRHT